MKLYAFHPEGHGPLSFFVMASSEAEARQSVADYIRGRPESDSYFHEDFPKGYSVEVFEVGQVAENDND